MPFQVSPGVISPEIDLTTIVPAVSTSEGALSGVFRWGPVEERILCADETDYALKFGFPDNGNFETWFTGANFMSYGAALFVVRASNNATSALAGPSYNVSTVSATTVKNDIDFETQGGAVANSGTTYYVARYPGTMGNSLRISVCDSSNAYTSTLTSTDANNLVTFSFTVGSNVVVMNVQNSANDTASATTSANNLLNSLTVTDYVMAGNNVTGTQFLKVSGKGTIATVNTSTVTANISLSSILTLASNVSANNLTRFWEFYSVVDRAPGTSSYVANAGGAGDEMHVVVVDDNGAFTGVRGEVLEVFRALSRATNAQGEEGGSNYYKTVINHDSGYVRWCFDRAGATSATASAVTGVNTVPLSLKFYGGVDTDDEQTISIAALARGYNLFKSSEDIDVSLILQGKARGGILDTQLGNWLIDNISETRRDCVTFISPRREASVFNTLTPAEDTVAFRNQLRSTSYAVLDSGYKYMYDRYNDVYRWVPMNGDTAGLCVRTDQNRDPWWSPAGFNRGNLKNLVKLAFNPNHAQRDLLYKAGVNPIVTFPGQGTILFGDKTLLAKPSAFDRINVRRLFIVLEKAISTAARYAILFEFNDEFTRAQFRNLVEPYLRDIHGRRGIYDFKVVCDTTNNTPEVIDRNEFIGDIYIKPARSINFITLNFVAVRTGVEFSEVVGKF
jgi:hypothetical protein